MVRLNSTKSRNTGKNKFYIIYVFKSKFEEMRETTLENQTVEKLS
jgi:hypothetical protein